MTLFVTNLSDRTTPADLAILFARYGLVVGADIVHAADGDTRPRVGVIEMDLGRRAESPRLGEVICRERRLHVSLELPHGKSAHDR
jgi:hypothetical protein